MLRLTTAAMAAATLWASAAFAQQPYQPYQDYQNYQNYTVPCDSIHDSWHDGEHCNIGPRNPVAPSRSEPANRRTGSTFGAYGSYAGQ